MEKKTFLDKLFHVITIAGTAILMNLLFLVSCLPVVTIGQAWCGLVGAIRYNIRGDKWFEGFKAGFCHRFLRGTIAWCVMLPVNVYMLLDLQYAYVGGYIVPMIAAAIMFCLTAMLTTALLILNVYVPTKISLWVKNAANMVFKSPLMLLAAAVANWLPVLLFLLFPLGFFYAIMIFIAAYFSMSALCATFALKEPLTLYLLEARANGTLLVEEGKIKQTTDKDEEE